MPLVRAAADARVVKIPAPPACYWLGLLEIEAAGESASGEVDVRPRLVAGKCQK
jgi:hypothetical protein